jgi:hypothetical protein
MQLLEPGQSLTSVHCHFHPKTSLHPSHFDTHSHFFLAIFGSGIQNLEPFRTKKNGAEHVPAKQQQQYYLFIGTPLFSLL